MKGSAALTEDVREDQKAIEDVRADGMTSHRKYKISVVEKLSDPHVIVAVDQTFYFSKDSKTVKSESIAIYVVKSHGGKLLVALETSNKKS